MHSMLKMDNEPYKEWINLYDKNFENIWYAEQSELRNAAILLRALDNEFKRIHKEAESKFMLLKNNVHMNKDFVFCEKENITVNQSFNSPEVFLDIKSSESPAENCTNKGSESIEITKENICTSPKINRASKLSKLKKLKQCSALNYSALNIKQSKVTDIIDSTIIDKTPEMPSISKRTKSKYKLSTGKLKNSIDGTLTHSHQTFLDTSSRTKDFDNIGQLTSCGDRLEFNALDKTPKEQNNQELKRNFIFKEPVVRGKARQNLEGWDCRECKEYYEGLNLNTQETKRLLNKCSKHRSKFEQVDYTPKGFWDLDFPPTPPKKKSLSDSTFFQY